MKYIFLVLLISIMTACNVTGIKADYAVPLDADSFITFSTEKTGNSEMNRRVYIHGERVCQIDDAGMVGLMNSKTIGLPSISNQEIRVSSQKEIIVSSPSGFLVGPKTGFVCQPIVSFKTVSGLTYHVKFSSCNVVSVTTDDGESVPFKAVDECVVSSKKQSNTKIFYLTEKT